LVIPVRSVPNDSYPAYVPIYPKEADVKKRSYLVCFDIRPILMTEKIVEDNLNFNITQKSLIHLAFTHQVLFKLNIIQDVESKIEKGFILDYYLSVLSDINNF